MIEAIATSLLALFGGAGVLVLLVQYLARSLVEKKLAEELKKYQGRLDQELETHKDALRRESDKEIELLRSQFHMEAQRAQIMHGGLFDRQFDALSSMYGALVALQEASLRREHLPPTADNRDLLFNCVKEANTLSQRCALLLPPELISSYNNFTHKLMLSVEQLKRLETMQERISDNFDQQEKLLSQIANVDRILRVDLPKAHVAIVDSMQKLLGADYWNRDAKRPS